MISTNSTDTVFRATQPGWRDYMLLLLFCLVVFGITLVSGRPLSIHESVLPQSSREMMADQDWIVPKKGGTPWLESPPLPQWVTVGLATAFGRCDAVWIVRLGPVLMGTAVVLMVAWMASVWFGRNMGLLSGFAMATTCQLTRYAWLAEDEIFLCACVTAAMAWFVFMEFVEEQRKPFAQEHSLNFTGLAKIILGPRSWGTLGFFVALGITNFCKHFLFGTAMVGVPIATFILLTGDWRRISRYFWFWGWAAYALLLVSWPLAAYQRYPDVLPLWFLDLGGRLDGTYAAINEPPWYYAINLLWVIAPWTIVVPFGLWQVRQQIWQERKSPERFLLCWAISIPLFFSLAHGKHHHYLLHALAPWTMLGSIGLVTLYQIFQTWPNWLRNPFWSLLSIATPACLVIWLLQDKIPGPQWVPQVALIVLPVITVVLAWTMLQRNPRIAASSLFASLAIAYCFGHWYAGAFADRHRFDADFLTKVNKQISTEDALFVDMDVQPLRGFFCLFYLDDHARGLHNISFLRDERILETEVYVVTRVNKEAELATLGNPVLLLVSEKTGRERSAEDRLALFRLKYDANAKRYQAADVRITPMQAAYREAGPTLGAL